MTSRAETWPRRSPPPTRSSPRSPRRRPIRSTWSAARCATCCWDAGGPTSTWSVEGDPAALAAALGAEPLAAHERFGTLKVELDGEEIDIAAARRETLRRPGALPTVELGAPIRTDLARRDFTVNAMAVPLAEPRELIDPYDGQADLERGLLRVIHDASFVDDPTRAIRAARYAARFGFELEERTEELLRATDLATVTPERRAGPSCAAWREEATGVRGLELLAGWGLVEPRAGRRVVRAGARRRPPAGRAALVRGGRPGRCDPRRGARTRGRGGGPGERPSVAAVRGRRAGPRPRPDRARPRPRRRRHLARRLARLARGARSRSPAPT